VASNPANALKGLVLLGAGVPVFLYWRRRTSGARALEASGVGGMTNYIESESIDPKAEAPTAGAKRTRGST